MSAFLLSKPHIDVLTNAAVQFLRISPKEAERLGQLLWEENYRSVNFRYREDEKCPKYVREVWDAPFHPGAILHAIACYEYQSCECMDWEETEAAKWMKDLEEAVWKFVHKHGIFKHEVKTVEKNTPWGIEDMRDVPVYVKENA